MLHRVMGWLRRAIGPTQAKTAPLLALPDHSSPAPAQEREPLVLDATEPLTPADEALLANAREQWQAGDWQSLVALDHARIQQHPERARLALLAAAGQAQTGDMNAARQLIRQAEEWGCSKRQIAQILISGTYLSLSRAALAGEEEQRALSYSSRAAALGPQHRRPASPRQV